MRGILRLGSFRGRASRGEFALVFLITLGLEVVHFIVVTHWPGIARRGALSDASWGVTALLCWVELAVSARRLHDLDKTGWLLVFYMVPLVGLIILIWSFGRPGTTDPTRFELDPNGRGAVTA